MKKVVIATNSDLSENPRVTNMCMSLLNQGYKVSLVGRALSTSPPASTSDIETHRIKCVFSKGSNFYREYNYRLSGFLKKSNADIYGAVDLDTLRPVTEAAGRKNKPVFFDATRWFEEKEEHLKKKNHWIKVAQKHLSKCKTRFTVSEGMALQLEKTYGPSFDVLLNAPKKLEVEPGSVREETLLYLGPLASGRGLPEIIETMHEIEAKLVFVEDGPMREELWALASKENLLHKVIFKSNISEEEKRDLLYKSRVGINLLDKSSKTDKHSLNREFFELVNAGMPQVFLDLPDYKALYQQYRIGAPTYDLKKSSLAYAINHLLQDRNYWFNTHTECLQARQHWCWEKEEKKFLEMIGTL